MPQSDGTTLPPERIRAGAERRRWAAALIAARQARGLSQQQASHDAGLSQATVSRIEHATTTPNRDSLDRLVTALGITLTATATTSEQLAEIEQIIAERHAHQLEPTA